MLSTRPILPQLFYTPIFLYTSILLLAVVFVFTLVAALAVVLCHIEKLLCIKLSRLSVTSHCRVSKCTHSIVEFILLSFLFDEGFLFMLHFHIWSVSFNPHSGNWSFLVPKPFLVVFALFVFFSLKPQVLSQRWCMTLLLVEKIHRLKTKPHATHSCVTCIHHYLVTTWLPKVDGRATPNQC